MSLTSKIKEFALDLGYSKVGIIPADDFQEYIDEVTSRNEMYAFYIHSPYHPLDSAKPRSVMPTAKSIITTVYDYSQKEFPFVPDLAVAMENKEELVRSYAAWALGKIGGKQAIQILKENLSKETSATVKKEIEAALLVL